MATIDDLKQVLEKIDARMNALLALESKKQKSQKQQAAQQQSQVQQTQKAKSAKANAEKMVGRLVPRGGLKGMLGGIKGLGKGGLSSSLSSSLGNMAMNSAGQAAAGEGGMMAGPRAALGIVGAWAAAMTKAAPALRDFSNEIIDTNKRFEQFSGTMAAIFGEKEINDALRSQRMGEATSGSAEALLKGREKNDKIWESIDIDIQNIKNEFGVVAEGIEEWFLNQWIKPAMDFLKEIAAKFGYVIGKYESEEKIDTFAEWLEQRAHTAMRPGAPIR